MQGCVLPFAAVEDKAVFSAYCTSDENGASTDNQSPFTSSPPFVFCAFFYIVYKT